MAVGALFRAARAALFAKPTPVRQLSKRARQHAVRRVVEFGIESLDDTAELLTNIASKRDPAEISYTGLDPFEERPTSGVALSLIDAHRVLAATGVRPRLLPGDPESTVAVIANGLADTDLLIIPRGLGSRPDSPLWFYLPRMCHPGTLVVELSQDEGNGASWATWSLAEVSQMAVSRGPSRRAAA